MRRVQLIPIGAARFLSLPLVTTAFLPLATQGLAYSVTLTVSGGSAPYAWSISGVLDSGLSLNSLTGVISGVPTTPAINQLTITVVDANARQSSITLPLQVVASTAPAITSASPLPTGTVGVQYSVTLTATQGTPPYTWSYTGALAASLVLNTVQGIISGIPQAVSTSTLNMTVTDSVGNFGTKTLVLPVQAGTGTALAVTTASLPNATFGVAYTTTLAATGGTAPYTWSILGGGSQLPTGLSLAASTGIISGTPTAAYTTGSGMIVQVTDAVSATATATLPMTVTLTAPGQPTNVVATAGNTTATITWTAPTNTGGSAITGYDIKNVLSGVITGAAQSFGSSPATFTGLVNGTPVQFVVYAKNAIGTGAASTFSNSVTPVAPGAGAPQAPTNLLMTLQGQNTASSTTSAPTPPAPNTTSIAWTASVPGSNPIASYNVYRSTNGGAYSLIGNTVALTYKDDTATLSVNGTAGSTSPFYSANTYLYKVTALDNQSVESAQSANQVFYIYRNNVFNWGGDYDFAMTTDYHDTTGDPSGCIANTTTSAFGGFLPYSGNLTTQWNMWVGAFKYINISMKPTHASQTFNLYALRVGDVTIYNNTGHGYSVSLTAYGPAPVVGTWATYKVPLADFLTDYGSTGAGPAVVQNALYKWSLQDTLGLAGNLWYLKDIFLSVT